MRLFHESMYHEKKGFFTMTYRREDLPKGGSLEKVEFQRFWKRLRKELDVKIKYFACGEYGERFGRPHYHAIVFGIGLDSKDVVEGAWGHGSVDVGTVSIRSARYVADYMDKKETSNRVLGVRERPFQLYSLGLGKRFAIDHAAQIRKSKWVSVDGLRSSLPRYYRKVLEVGSEFYAEELESNAVETVNRVMKEQGVDVSNRRLTDAEKRLVYECLERERSSLKVVTERRVALSKKGF